MVRYLASGVGTAKSLPQGVEFAQMMVVAERMVRQKIAEEGQLAGDDTCWCISLQLRHANVGFFCVSAARFPGGLGHPSGPSDIGTSRGVDQ